MSTQNIVLAVRDVFIAQASRVGGVLTYGTPRKISTAANVAIALTKAPLQHRESGRLLINKTLVTDAKVTVQTANLSDEDKMEMYYSLTAPQEGSRYLIGKAADQPMALAVGFYVKTERGYKAWWFRNASAAPSDETYATETEQGPQIQTESIEFSCIREFDDEPIYDFEPNLADQTAVDAFFAAVRPTTPDKTVGAAIYNVTAPVKAATPQASHNAGTGYTAALAWSPAAGTFAPTTVYKATITLTAAAGYVFAPGFNASDVQGLPTTGFSAASVTRVSATQVVIEVTYNATAA